MTASIVLSVVYDHPTVSSPNDPIVTRVNEFIETASHYALPGNYLVEFFTWMRYIPSSIAKWKREAEEGYKEYSKMFVGMFHDVETRIVTSYLFDPLYFLIHLWGQKQGDERPSFVGSLIRESERHRLRPIEAAWLAASI